MQPQTIFDLQRTLKMAMAGETKAEGAKFPTGIIIDLREPEGNVFYIMGPRPCSVFQNYLLNKGQQPLDFYDIYTII